jgi:uncharacterized paraquat-inducible protein A
MWVHRFDREAYDKRKEQGLCVQCGDVSDGHARCKRCRTKGAESAKRSYMRKVAKHGQESV